MFNVCVVREEKLWVILDVMEGHIGMMEVAFGVVVEEWLGSFGERNL